MTGEARGGLAALCFLGVGLASTALAFVLPMVSFLDWRAGDGAGVSRAEAVLFASMVAGFALVRLGSPAVIRHGYAVRGEAPPDPLPVRPAGWGWRLSFWALVLAAMVVS